jgi:hypothetical protein
MTPSTALGKTCAAAGRSARIGDHYSIDCYALTGFRVDRQAASLSLGHERRLRFARRGAPRARPAPGRRPRRNRIARGRIIQNDWRRDGDDGRELVCALAAFGPDINAASDCPADLMPQWLAEMVPVLDDGIARRTCRGSWASCSSARRRGHPRRCRVGAHSHRLHDRLARQALASAAPASPTRSPPIGRTSSTPSSASRRRSKGRSRRAESG